MLEHGLGYTERVHDLSISVYTLARYCAHHFVFGVIARNYGLECAKLKFLQLLRTAQILLHLYAQTTCVAEIQRYLSFRLDFVDELRIE